MSNNESLLENQKAVQQQDNSLELLKKLLGKTQTEREEEQKENQPTGFSFSSPIIPYYNLFKLLDDEFYFLQLPLGTEDFINMSGQDFVQTQVIQTKKPYTRFFTYPYDERTAGSLFGSYGRNLDTAFNKYFNQIRQTVKGRQLDEETGRYSLVSYKDLNYSKHPVSVRKSKLILGIVLEKSDIPRTIINTVLKQEDGLTVTDDNGNPVFEQKKVQVDDFFVKEVGDIFEKGKNVLEKDAPRYKLIWLQLSGKQDSELNKVKSRYANKTKKVKLADGTVIDADFDVKHPTNGCILKFSKKKINNVIEHPIVDIPLNGLLVKTAKKDGKTIGVPTELGREIRDILIKNSPLKEKFEAYAEKVAAQGRELTHADIISSINAIPTLNSMDLYKKMLQPDQVGDMVKTMKESIDNFLRETFPEKYDNEPKIEEADQEQEEKMALPNVVKLTQEDKEKAALVEDAVVDDSNDDDFDDDDMPF